MSHKAPIIPGTLGTRDPPYSSSENVSQKSASFVMQLTFHLLQVASESIKESVAVRISNRINEDYLAEAHFTPSWEGGSLVDLHVTDPGATKEYAILVWRQLEGVEKEETIGVGDSGNDIPIFHSSGLKVATGNATPTLKELADYVAPSVTENALAHVIDSFLIR
jgi:hydroxymethylpyrimidine pyrophosphatase-like HAD family hydrolase